MLLYRAENGGAAWSYEDWHVPLPLHGAGFVGKFLDEIIAHGQTESWSHARVDLGQPVNRLGRQRAVRAIEFFRGRGFSVYHDGDRAVFERAFRRDV